MHFIGQERDSMKGEILFELFMGDADPSYVIKQGLTKLTKIAMGDIAMAESILEYAKNEQVLIDMQHQHLMLYAMG